MFEDNFPYAHGVLGLSESEFWHCTPRKIKVYAKAHKEQVKEQNMLNYINGIYTMRGFAVVLSQAFSKNSKAEYFDEPIQIYELTEEEKQLAQERELQKVISFFTGMEKSNNKEDK